MTASGEEDEDADASLRQSVRDAFEGREFKPVQEGSFWYCDNCSSEESFGTTATHYLADRVLNQGRIGASLSESGLKLLASYCRDCSLHRVIWPHQGTNELIIEDDLAADYRHENVSVVDVSRATEGEPFDARAAWVEISGIDFDMWAETVGQQSGSYRHSLRGPENMVTTFLSLGIDPVELFHSDGSLDPEGIESGRQAFTEAHRGEREIGLDPEAFSERVRERMQKRKDSSFLDE